ncbi:MAG: DHHA1 domain-containing protein, partial [Janthinobacterium lividum]
EKYDSEVRVVSMGKFVDNNNHYSLELCGGTHAARTGDIGMFKIISENAIAAGIRRIEAVCGVSALKIARENDELLCQLTDLLKSSKSEIYHKLSSLLNVKKDLETELLALKIATLDIALEKIDQESVNVNDVRFIFKIIKNLDSKTVRLAAEQLSLKTSNLIVVYVCNLGDKISATIALSKSLTGKFSASDIAHMMAKSFGGNGGGQTTLAQVGGIDGNKLSLIFAEITSYIENIS